MRIAFSLLLALSALSLDEAAFAVAPPAMLPSASAKPAWLGIQMDVAGVGGVLVKHVVRGSPAEVAGFKDGDIVTAVGDAKVNRPEQVSGLVSSHAAGETIAVSVNRAGANVVLRVVLAERPTGDGMLRMDHIGSFAKAWVGTKSIAAAPKTLSELRGKVVLIDFWATWCGPCRFISPKLSALQGRFGAQGFKVVGITTDAPEVAATFAEKSQMKYSIVSDESGETSRAYGVSGIPTLFIVDKKGVIRDVFVGYNDEFDARLESQITALLKEP